MIVNMLRLPSKLFISEYNFDIVKYGANGVRDFYVLQHYFVKYGMLSKEKYTPERLYHYLYALGLGIDGSSGIAKLADIVDEKLDNSYDSHVQFINASNFEKYFGMSMEQINIFMNEIVLHEMNTETSRWAVNIEFIRHLNNIKSALAVSLNHKMVKEINWIGWVVLSKEHGFVDYFNEVVIFDDRQQLKELRAVIHKETTPEYCYR